MDGQMDGCLYLYRKRLAAFEFASDARVECAVVFIGGLTDGLLSSPYVPPLARALRENGTATLVQPLLTSSYGGFGISSLDTDANEILELLRYLGAKRGFTKFVLIGHSTGCQDIVHFFRKHGGTPEAAAVHGAVLQGPVSDREAMRSKFAEDGDPSVSKEVLSEAAKMIRDGRGNMPMKDWLCYDRFPISAERLWSLCGEKLTLDDMFSSDLTDDELRQALTLPAGKWPERVIIAQSMNDEYIPPHVDKERLASRISKMIPKSEILLIPDVHAVAGEEGIKAIIGAVINILPK